MTLGPCQTHALRYQITNLYVRHTHEHTNKGVGNRLLVIGRREVRYVELQSCRAGVYRAIGNIGEVDDGVDNSLRLQADGDAVEFLSTHV